MKISDTSGYRIFPISISKNLSNKEAFIYLSLLFKSDYKTGESNVLLETLSKETGYDSETVSGYLHKAKEYKYIEITPKTCGKKEDGSTKTKNFYKIHIPQKDFIMVNREFLDFHIENLSIKEETDLKGFILLIKCICLNNCNFTYYSLREMAEHLKISYATIHKLMRKCRDLELITYHKKYYKIMLDYFDLGNTGYFPKGTPDLYKEIYNTIKLFCENKGFEAPPYKREFISQIAVKYNMTKTELKESKDIEFIKKYSVKYQLGERLPNINEPINSLNYFVKVLTNKNYTLPVNQEQTSIKI